MPGQRSKGNPDPSLALAPGAGGIAAAGRDDRAVLRDSVDVAGWRHAAAGAGLAHGKSGCSSAVLDHSGSTERTAPGTHCPDKTVAAEPLRHEPPCVSAGGAGQRLGLRGRLEPVWLWWPDEGCHTGTPSLQRRGSFRLPASKLHYTVTDSLMIGRMTRAFGADDVVRLRRNPKNDD
jgi:hypothetical protein